jgi:hypothetical protein
MNELIEEDDAVKEDVGKEQVLKESVGRRMVECPCVQVLRKRINVDVNQVVPLTTNSQRILNCNVDHHSGRRR